MPTIVGEQYSAFALNPETFLSVAKGRRTECSSSVATKICIVLLVMHYIGKASRDGCTLNDKQTVKKSFGRFIQASYISQLPQSKVDIVIGFSEPETSEKNCHSIGGWDFLLCFTVNTLAIGWNARKGVDDACTRLGVIRRNVVLVANM